MRGTTGQASQLERPTRDGQDGNRLCRHAICAREPACDRDRMLSRPGGRRKIGLLLGRSSGCADCVAPSLLTKPPNAPRGHALSTCPSAGGRPREERVYMARAAYDITQGSRGGTCARAASCRCVSGRVAACRGLVFGDETHRQGGERGTRADTRDARRHLSC